MHKSLISTISILGLAFALVGCKGGSSSGENMAIVNGVPISKDEYISHLERKVQVLVQSQQGPVQATVAQPLNFQALNDLVNQKLLLQMAKKENVLPTDEDINKELEFQSTKRSDFVSSLTAQGMTLSEIKNELMISLCRHNLLSKGIHISDAQVDAYIKDNPKQFETPPMVDLTWITLKNADDKPKVDADLKSGQTFSVVSKQYSTQTSPQYPTRDYTRFPDRLKQVVDKLNENGTSEWLQDGATWVKFHVEKKTPAGKIEVKPWMKTEIQRSLAEQKGAAAVDLDKRLLDMRKQAEINITKPGLKERFDQLSRTLKEADMKNGTGSANKGEAPADNNAEAKN
ncbi:MAG: SurA N-terminal domain-containing protein [Armatimonadetes bacterium]|nr:SurA N-terminal domain-containing protein [Armatimonadota bacterium]MBS1728848.1 SurA N-terminal domain-containing protein [Armatimonadota bacterium]